MNKELTPPAYQDLLQDIGQPLHTAAAQAVNTLHGRGFGRSNVFYMRKLYLSFQNSGALSHKLSWSHHDEILKADEPLEISFYTQQTDNGGVV